MSQAQSEPVSVALDLVDRWVESLNGDPILSVSDEINLRNVVSKAIVEAERRGVLLERGECIKIAEDFAWNEKHVTYRDDRAQTALDIATAIRARGTMEDR